MSLTRSSYEDCTTPGIFCWMLLSDLVSGMAGRGHDHHTGRVVPVVLAQRQIWIGLKVDKAYKQVTRLLCRYNRRNSTWVQTLAIRATTVTYRRSGPHWMQARAMRNVRRPPGPNSVPATTVLIIAWCTPYLEFWAQTEP